MLKKIIFTLLNLCASTDLRAQLSEPDSSRFRSMIFRIFSLDRIDPNDYEKGYIFDRIFEDSLGTFQAIVGGFLGDALE